MEHAYSDDGPILLDLLLPVEDSLSESVVFCFSHCDASKLGNLLYDTCSSVLDMLDVVSDGILGRVLGNVLYGASIASEIGPSHAL